MHISVLADADMDWIIPVVGLVVGLAGGTLINAVFLRAACKWVAKIDFEFKPAILISLLVGVITLVLNFGLIFAVAMLSNDMHYLVYPAQAVGPAISLPIAGGLYGIMIKDPDKYPVSMAHIGFGKGMLVALVTYLIGGVILGGALAAIVYTGNGHYLHIP